MNFDQLITKSGEWLRGTGPDSDVVISTRIRLARNLAGLPFITRANKQQKADCEKRVKAAISQSGFQPKLEYVSMEDIQGLDRKLLLERQLISRDLVAALEGPRGVAFDERESVSVMVNEEDHLRIQVMRSGLALNDAWDEINHVDNQLEAHLDYAFHERFGYLTACPTNVGTGLRASVMLHLPALGITKQLDKVFKALQKLNLVVRGLNGEGSPVTGDLYQISNQVTLGKSEPMLLEELREVMSSVLDYERGYRKTLLKERRQAEQDRVARAIGTLSSATLITSDETMELLSAVRLGIHLNLLDDMPPNVLNQLFINCQSAHLQKIEGKELDGQARNAARAKYLRNTLRNLGGQ